MGIVLRHDAAGISPLGNGQASKYGQALALQQRKYDLDTMQRQQDQNYDMQRNYANQGFQLNRDMNNNFADVEEALAKGQFDPATAKKVKQNMILYSEAMTNPGLDATQRSEAMSIARSNMVPLLSMRRDAPRQPTATEELYGRIGYAAGQPFLKDSNNNFTRIEPQQSQQSPMPQQPVGVSVAGQAFQDPKVRDYFVGLAQNALSKGGVDITASSDPEALFSKAEEIYNSYHKRFYGQPESQAQNAPPSGSPSPAPAPKPGSRGYMFIKPKGKSVTQLGDPNAQAEQSAMARSGWGDGQVELSPTGNPMTVDTQYEMNNPQQSPGINYFDPNNPAYAAMRAPQMKQPQAAPQYPGAYGLGGVDFGVNKDTGNQVTASVRPGGTMLEYDKKDPVVVRPPITNDMFPKRPDPATVSSGEDMARQAEIDKMRAQKEAEQRKSQRESLFGGLIENTKDEFDRVKLENVRDFLGQGQPPEVEAAIMIGYSPDTTDEQKLEAAKFLRSKGISVRDITNNAKPKRPPLYPTTRSNPKNEYPTTRGTYSY